MILKNFDMTSYDANPEKWQFSFRSPKSAILPRVIGNFDDPVPIGSSDWQCLLLSAGMAIGSLKTTTREWKVVSRAPDSLERVWYFTVERFVLASSSTVVQIH